MVELLDAESRLQQVQGQADNNFIPFSADPDEWEILERGAVFLFQFYPKTLIREWNVRKFDLEF